MDGVPSQAAGGSAGAFRRLKGLPRWGFISAALASGAVLTLFVMMIGSQDETTLTGTFTVLDEADCDLSLGYSDIHPGTEVVLSGEAGETLATGSFGLGTDTAQGCQFRFTIEDVPQQEHYTISVSHRGDIGYDRAELEDADWHVELTL